MLQNEMDKLRSDNVKLYEKIKFLQAYPNKVSTGIQCVSEAIFWWHFIVPVIDSISPKDSRTRRGTNDVIAVASLA
jgi:hypothetical protein